MVSARRPFRFPPCERDRERPRTSENQATIAPDVEGSKRNNWYVNPFFASLFQEEDIRYRGLSMLRT